MSKKKAAAEESGAADSEPDETDEAVAAGQRMLPFSAEFNPRQISLLTLLKIVQERSGNSATIASGIAAAFPKIGTSGLKRVKNVPIGMKNYGLYDSESWSLNPLGNELLGLASDSARHERFATHILENLHGLDLIQVVHDLRLRNERANKTSIDVELRRRGFRMPGDTTRHLVMLYWLELAGVCAYDKSAASWVVNDARVKTLVGIGLGEVDEFSSLTQIQRLFLRTMQGISDVEGANPVSTSRVRSETEMQYGVAFKGAMREKVIRPLESQGWISTSEMQSAGKSGKVAATTKLIELNFDLARRLSTGLIPSELRCRLNTPLDAMYGSLQNGSKNEQGVALELLALRMAYDVGLSPMGFRERSADTGGAEVDLIAEGAHLLFSRWLFQCKATPGTVNLADLAKEIGMATLLHAHVVVMVTRGRFSKDLREHAAKAAENTHLQVVLIDGPVLKAHKSQGSTALLDHLLNVSASTLRVKRPQVVGIA